jgi:hypothetical protein
MQTIIKTASVKVMQSYNYCHFEASATIENENGLTSAEIDEARKKCQRLTDKAVGQYKKAKEEAAKRSDGQFRMKNFEEECKRILAKDEQDRTIREIAMLKQYQDENWQAQFEDDYDYDDDEEYNF